MSTSYDAVGGVDQNRIALNRQAAAAYQAQVEAERQAQAEQETRRAAEQRRIDAANRSRRVKLTAPAPKDKDDEFDAIFKAYGSKNYLKEGKITQEQYDASLKGQANAQGGDISRADIKITDGKLTAKADVHEVGYRGKSTAKIIESKNIQPKIESAPIKPTSSSAYEILGRTGRGTVMVRDPRGNITEQNERLYPSALGFTPRETPSVAGYTKNYDKEGKLVSQEYYTDDSVRQIEKGLNAKGETVIGAEYHNEKGKVFSLPADYFRAPHKQYADRPFILAAPSKEESVENTGPYVEPIANRFFGSRRIGDIVNEEVAKGDKGLYGPKEVYDDKEVKRFIGEYSANQRFAAGEGEMDFGIATPKQGRVGVYESAGPQGSIQTTVVTRQEMPSSIAEEIGFVKPEGGFLEGLGSYFYNIPASIGKTGQERLLGQKSNIVVQPEAEGEFFDTLIKGGKDAVTGKSITIQSDLEAQGSRIQSNPTYYAGSLLGTGIFTVATLGIGPALKAGKVGLSVAKGVVSAEKDIVAIGKTSAELVGAESTGVRAVKVVDGGRSLVGLAKNKLGIYTEPRQINIPFMGKKTIQRITKPDVYAIESKTEDIGFVSAKTGKSAIITNELSTAEKTRLIDKGVAPTKIDTPVKAETITDVYQSEAKVMPRVSVPVVAGKVEKTPGAIVIQAGKTTGKVAESRPVGASIVAYNKKDVLGLVKNREKESSLSKAAAEKLGKIPEPKGSSNLNFSVKAGKVNKSSKTPLENALIPVYDRGFAEAGKRLSASQKAAVNIASESDKGSSLIGKIGLGGGAAIYGAKDSFGFKGETGAGRKSKAEESTDYDVSFNVTPKSANKIGFKQSTKSLTDQTTVPKLDTKLSTKQVTTQKANTRTGELLSVKPFRSSVSLFDIKQKNETNQRTGIVTMTDTIQSAKSATKTKTDVLSKVQFDMPKMNAPRFNLPPREPVQLKKNVRKRKKLGFGATKTKGLGVTNILARGFSIKPEGKGRRKGRKGYLGV